MSKIACPCIECVHNGEKYICDCENINLRFRNMNTVNEGRVDMWVCNQYQKTEEYKRIEKQLESMVLEKFGDCI